MPMTSRERLPFVTPEQVREEVLRCSDALGESGGYLCGPDHHLKPDVPAANAIALFETATAYRRAGYTAAVPSIGSARPAAGDTCPMSLVHKPDWEETKQRYLGWWDHEYFGRCALAVTAPLDHPPDVLEPPAARTPAEQWYDLDLISARNRYHLSRTFFGGEALPIWSGGYPGHTAIPNFLGCPLSLDMTTGWWDPVLRDENSLDYRSLRIDESHPDYEFNFRMLRRAAQESAGRCLPSIGAFGGCGDTLAAVRGTTRLLLDCVERPEEVGAAELYLMAMWCDFYDRCYATIHEAAQGSTCWFPLWSPGRFYAAQNDFSYNISPRMFEEIFIPALEQQTRFLDHCVYHVDGVNAFVHVGALCELSRLQALQILPGAGKPSPLHYLDVLRQVQWAGKNLHIGLDPVEVEPALSVLSARGLFISTWCATESEARELLRSVGKWSVDRG